MSLFHMPRRTAAVRTLPDTQTVGTMDVGQTRYVAPWAMHIDSDGMYLLNPDMLVSEYIEGDHQLLVSVLRDGYHAAAQSHQHWVPVTPVFDGYYTPNWIAVRQVRILIP